MLDPSHPLALLLKSDPRYHFNAYFFMFEALRYAQEELGLGGSVTEEAAERFEEIEGIKKSNEGEDLEDPEEHEEQHITGQDLCEAIRKFALSQYGYMAKSVLNEWGIKETGDFGEIVYSLIEIGQMRKNEADRREDFNEVYDFEEALQKDFEFSQQPETPTDC